MNGETIKRWTSSTMVMIMEKKQMTPSAFQLTTNFVLIVAGVLIHCGIAWTTFSHTFSTLADTFPVDPCPEFDFFFSILAGAAMDATLTALTLSRAAVREWHWKIALVVAMGAMIFYFTLSSTYTIVSSLVAFGGMLNYVYAKFNSSSEKGKAKAVVRIGIVDKYMKGTPDYHDLSWRRNWKYFAITLCQATTIYYRKVTFYSGFTFVVVDALWNRIAGESRTRFSDYYVSVFTAAMDTGVNMVLLGVPASTESPHFTVAGLVFYLGLVEVLVRLNNATIQKIYAMANNETRWFGFAMYLVVTTWIGRWKHAMVIGFFHVLANGLFMVVSAEVVPYFVLGRPYVSTHKQKLHCICGD